MRVKNCVCIFLLLISAGCSTGLKQRDIRECRELAFANQAASVASIDAKYQQCLDDTKESKKAQQQLKFVESIMESIFDVLDL